MNDINALISMAGNNVVSAIKGAAADTGIDFAYLLQQAKAESSFDAGAKAKTSSASGLFQFIESTWTDMVEKHGHKFGIGASSMSKKDVLDLRFDPEISSGMAAEFARDNKQFLEMHWGGDVGSTELYFAHFMGAGGAASFLNARDKNPMQEAAVLFPAAAKANQNVFYDSATGRAKSLDEVYAFFDKKFQIEGELPGNIAAPAVKESFIASETSSAAKGIHPFMLANPRQEVNIYQRTRSYNDYAARALLPFKTSLLSNPAEILLLSQLQSPISR